MAVRLMESWLGSYVCPYRRERSEKSLLESQETLLSLSSRTPDKG
ncbi:hypothetical protein [Helicobacter marmotae]|nr:hypothetical protein [Helicobacter marmotae]